MRFFRPGLLVVLCVVITANSVLASQESQKVQAASGVLVNKDVVEMVSAGLSSEIILAKINSSRCDFDTSASGLKDLKTANVPDTVMLAMIAAPVPSNALVPTPESSVPPVQYNPPPPGTVYGSSTCSKVVSIALADASGVRPSMGTGNWAENWIRKNSKNYPNICFSQQPMAERTNYLVVFSQSPSYFAGFDPVVETNTSTVASPVSGTGTVTDNYGRQWNYTYDGTATTTTSTTTHENVPYTINTNTVFANAYDSNGAMVSRRYHVYSTKTGGDGANALGYNLGNALRAINSRGRLLASVVNDIDGKK
jgi:hypothetical protein